MVEHFPNRVKAIESILDYMKHSTEPFYVCQGKHRCEAAAQNRPPEEFEVCPWCHVIEPGDRRSALQIEKDIVKQQVGH